MQNKYGGCRFLTPQSARCLVIMVTNTLQYFPSYWLQRSTVCRLGKVRINLHMESRCLKEKKPEHDRQKTTGTFTTCSLQVSPKAQRFLIDLFLYTDFCYRRYSNPWWASTSRVGNSLSQGPTTGLVFRISLTLHRCLNQSLAWYLKSHFLF